MMLNQPVVEFLLRFVLILRELRHGVEVEIKDWLEILSPYAVVVGAILVFYQFIRTVRHKSIVQERQKWRNDLRDLVPEFLNAADDPKRRACYDHIVLKLNPYEDIEEDIDPCRWLRLFLDEQSVVNREGVIAAFQDMLKRDWERSKNETSLFTSKAKENAERDVNAARERHRLKRMASDR